MHIENGILNSEKGGNGMSRKEKIKFLIENIKGVGPSKAEKIADLFPDVDNFVSLAFNKDAFEKLKSALGLSLANAFMDQIADIKRQDEAIQLMVSCGIPYFSALNVAKTEMLFEAFKNDPYTIGYNNKMVFAHCDKFAHIFFGDNAPDMSKARMRWMIDAMLFDLENSGHTFAYLMQLTRKINQYQKKHGYLPDNYENSTVLLYLLNNESIFIISSTKMLDLLNASL